MPVKVDRIGDWTAALTIGERIKKEIPPAMVDAMNGEFEDLQKKMENVVKRGLASGPALAPSTVAKKGHGKKLFDDGDLAEAFIMEKVTTKKDGFVGVGKKSVPGSGLTMDQLAAIQENGNAHIPARPFLSPLIDRESPKIIKRLQRAFRDEVFNLEP